MTAIFNQSNLLRQAGHKLLGNNKILPAIKENHLWVVMLVNSFRQFIQYVILHVIYNQRKGQAELHIIY